MAVEMSSTFLPQTVAVVSNFVAPHTEYDIRDNIEPIMDASETQQAAATDGPFPAFPAASTRHRANRAKRQNSIRLESYVEDAARYCIAFAPVQPVEVHSVQHCNMLQRVGDEPLAEHSLTVCTFPPAPPIYQEQQEPPITLPAVNTTYVPQYQPAPLHWAAATYQHSEDMTIKPSGLRGRQRSDMDVDWEPALEFDDVPVAKRQRGNTGNCYPRAGTHCTEDDDSMQRGRRRTSCKKMNLSARSLYRWKKYGSKEVVGFQHKRDYFRCNAPNCPVKRWIQLDNKGVLRVEYIESVHNHDLRPGDLEDPSVTPPPKRKYTSRKNKAALPTRGEEPSGAAPAHSEQAQDWVPPQPHNNSMVPIAQGDAAHRSAAAGAGNPVPSFEGTHSKRSSFAHLELDLQRSAVDLEVTSPEDPSISPFARAIGALPTPPAFQIDIAPADNGEIPDMVDGVEQGPSAAGPLAPLFSMSLSQPCMPAQLPDTKAGADTQEQAGRLPNVQCAALTAQRTESTVRTNSTLYSGVGFKNLLDDQPIVAAATSVPDDEACLEFELPGSSMALEELPIGQEQTIMAAPLLGHAALQDSSGFDGAGDDRLATCVQQHDTLELPTLNTLTQQELDDLVNGLSPADLNAFEVMLSSSSQGSGHSQHTQWQRQQQQQPPVQPSVSEQQQELAASWHAKPPLRAMSASPRVPAAYQQDAKPLVLHAPLFVREQAMIPTTAAMVPVHNMGSGMLDWAGAKPCVPTNTAIAVQGSGVPCKSTTTQSELNGNAPLVITPRLLCMPQKSMPVFPWSHSSVQHLQPPVHQQSELAVDTPGAYAELDLLA